MVRKELADMTGKKKFKRAVNREEGPLLIDFGSFPTTGIHCSIVEKLRDYYGLEKRPVKIQDSQQLLGFIDNDLKEAMGIETETIWSPVATYGFRTDGSYKEWRTPWGQEVLVPEDFNTTTNDKGEVFIYACGDMDYPPAGVLPKDGYYFSHIIRGGEFDESTYDVTDNFEEFGPLPESTLDFLREQKEKLEGTDRLVSLHIGGAEFGDIAMVPGPKLKDPKGIRDTAEWYMSLVTRPDAIHEIFTYQLGHALANLEKAHEILGDTVQVAYVCGTDLGTQNGLFFSKELYRELFHPYYKKVNDWIHENTSWKTFKHTDGAISELMPDLIESGFDIINPLQWTAKNMDRQEIKDQFGDDLIFWGGGIDAQKTLVYGTPEEVFNQALETCNILGENGGFIFNGNHNIQPDVPVENVVALIKAAHNFNGER